MLSDVITLIMLVYIVLSPVLVIKSIKFGLRCAEKPEEAAEKPVFTPVRRKKEPEVPPEVQRGLDIIANIDAYDGTDNGQKEIKND